MAAALLNLKHLFMFAAPLIFVQLLRHHVLLPSPTPTAALRRLASLGAIVVAVFALSLGPFLGQARM